MPVLTLNLSIVMDWLKVAQDLNRLSSPQLGFNFSFLVLTTDLLKSDKVPDVITRSLNHLSIY